ncbi:hypothetical protein PGB90_000432 [Kerria lacca]
MDIINVNNSLSGHYNSESDIKTTPSIITSETNTSAKFENHFGEGEQNNRKRKTRRFKGRSKGRYKKSKYVLRKMRERIYPQSEAPYNTNQFLMADHNNVENLDDKLSVPNTDRRCRNRESSFTSADSDDGQFYSSPEDEDEFLTKDFADTYQSLCAEKFGNLSKAQLTKIIFDLEAKVDELSKKLVTSSKLDEVSNILLQSNGVENKELRIEIKDILIENEKLRSENQELKQFIKDNAVSISSSSSSTSSDNSDSDSADNEKNSDNRYSTENENP